VEEDEGSGRAARRAGGACVVRTVAPSRSPPSREREREKRRRIQKQCGEEKQEPVYIFVSADLG
jgi:hypothetical protein